MYLQLINSHFRLVLFLEYDGYGQRSIDPAFDPHSGSISSRVTFASSKYHPRKPFIKADLVRNLPNGPYFISTRNGDIFKAFRLYSDHQLAFTEAAVRDETGGFMPLPAATEVFGNLLHACDFC